MRVRNIVYGTSANFEFMWGAKKERKKKKKEKKKRKKRKEKRRN